MATAKERDNIAQNLCDMTADTTMLECRRGGKLEFSLICLSKDLTTIMSKKRKGGVKGNVQTTVEIRRISNIRFGQHSEKFKKANRRDLENFSFSLFFTHVESNLEDSLDLVPKNEEQFQQWTKHIQELMDRFKKNFGVDDELVEHVNSKTPRLNQSSKNQAARAGKEKNEIYCFGWGEHGQNGDNQTENRGDPFLLDTLLGKGTLQVSAGWAHTVVLLENATVMQYGHQVATGLSERAKTPQLVASISPPNVLNDLLRIRGISCGNYHTLAVTEGGELFSWGVNVFGQLGHGDTVDRHSPTLIKTFAESNVSVVEIAAGGSFSLVLCGSLSSVSVWSWGLGERGALGHQDTRNQNTPKQIRDLDGLDVERIAAGDHHSLCATKNEMYSWGNNDFGQLGLGDEVTRTRPINVTGLKDCPVHSMSCGAAHSVVIAVVPKLNAKFIYSWGLNNHGQLGFESKEKYRNAPTALNNLGEVLKAPIVEVCCGFFHTLARDSDGDVLACGSNKYGQLGIPNNLGQNPQVHKLTYIDALKGKNGRRLCGGGEHTAILTARAWVDDSEAKDCMSCKDVFTFTVRKHHCRNCMGIFCQKCSSKRIAILEYELLNPERVCNNCYTQLGGR